MYLYPGAAMLVVAVEYAGPLGSRVRTLAVQRRWESHQPLEALEVYHVSLPFDFL